MKGSPRAPDYNGIRGSVQNFQKARFGAPTFGELVGGAKRDCGLFLPCSSLLAYGAYILSYSRVDDEEPSRAHRIHSEGALPGMHHSETYDPLSRLRPQAPQDLQLRDGFFGSFVRNHVYRCNQQLMEILLV
ncbi:hypothetical protein Y032_0154g2964 [Ancylostoma ceylanicum]|uniref:Uncharacterized protein n=1 Tax=Ancylostoma ceylanicum TaxID=53326 RepID=A0A016T042_9BILA|nr:hypothetical protein Y032_0154g2964 [Ancylostoma ceylanicum]